MPSSSTTVRPFSIIVALDAKGGIGKDGNIPWDCPQDRRFFFAETTKPLVHGTAPGSKVNVLIMGRRTWQSLPRRLKQRVCLVVSNTLEQHSQEDTIVYKSFPDALEAASRMEDVGRIFVVGGSKLYEDALKHPAATELVVSYIGGSGSDDYGCDTFFPTATAKAHGWGDIMTHVNPAEPLSIRRYRRNRPEITEALDQVAASPVEAPARRRSASCELAVAAITVLFGVIITHTLSAMTNDGK